MRHGAMTLMGGLVAGVLLLAGCADPGSTGGGASGSASPTGASPTGTRPADPDDLLLRLSRGGGLLPPSMSLALFPQVSLYADGTLITAGAQTAQYPGAALPPIFVQQVAVEDLPALMAQVERALAGLPEDLGTPNTADVPGLTITWDDAGTDREVYASSYGVGDESAGPGMTQEQVDARARVREVVLLADALQAGEVDGVAVSAAEPYAPDAWLVWSTPYQDPQDDLPPQPPRDWPGPALTASDEGPGYACTVAEGAQAQAITEAMQDAVSTTPWRDGGQRWSVVVRPLLPGDPRSCPEW